MLNRIPHMRGIDLAEAHELVKHDVAAIVSYPLRHAGKKRASDEPEDEPEDEPGESEKPGPSKKKQKTEGKTVPKDNPADRKYGSKNIPPLVKILILQHLRKQDLLKSEKMLSQECMNLISSSLAKRTWEKYNSALSAESSSSEEEEDDPPPKASKGTPNFKIPKYKQGEEWSDEQIENFRKVWPHLKNLDTSALKGASLRDIQKIGNQKLSSSKFLSQTMAAN